MSKRDNQLLVGDMLEAAQKIRAYCEGYTLETFLEDDRTIDAVVRNFEIIGEAANRAHPDFHAANPQIDWNSLRGFRNRLVHEYFGVDHEIVWQIIETELNELIDDLERLV
ncbi:MAG: DUF86 domain-containing protein [Flavobacteriales bacterium]|nr:DUF86 domain-containing protein [Flavobacteriales bacterium]